MSHSLQIQAFKAPLPRAEGFRLLIRPLCLRLGDTAWIFLNSTQ
jgi:hypothetical protein